MLSPAFFHRPTLTVARDLLGKRLCRRLPVDESDDRQIRQHPRVHGATIYGIITETEAYDGPDDRASHASRGRTPRNAAMFGEAGTIYIYLVYGVHWCLNLVTGATGYPAAALIRGVVVDGVPPQQTNGPGKVCRALHLTGQLNAQALGRSTGLWVEDAGISVPARHITTTPRCGVDYAGTYRRKPWRFVWTAKHELRIMNHGIGSIRHRDS